MEPIKIEPLWDNEEKQNEPTSEMLSDLQMAEVTTKNETESDYELECEEQNETRSEPIWNTGIKHESASDEEISQETTSDSPSRKLESGHVDIVKEEPSENEITIEETIVGMGSQEQTELEQDCGCSSSPAKIRKISSKNYTAKLRCLVPGCLSRLISHPHLTFFCLPTHDFKRDIWLQQIGREDMVGRGFFRHYVCELHFEDHYMKVNTKRKLLKNIAIPTLALPLQIPYIRNQEIQADPPLSTEIQQVSTQTDRICHSDNVTQTPIQLLKKIDKYEYTLRRMKELEKLGSLEPGEQIFRELCDLYLTKNLANIVKTNNHLKRNKLPCNAFKMACLAIYYFSPKAYWLFEKAFPLPPIATIKKLNYSISTTINPQLMMLLEAKVNHMTNKEKTCAVVIGLIKLKVGLFYDIKKDKIIGFQELEGAQDPVPARYALVLIIRGILVDWYQPLGYAFLSDCGPDILNNPCISSWVFRVTGSLFDIGLHVKVFVSDFIADLLNSTDIKAVTVKVPYFFLNNRKIYYVYDIPHLMGLVYWNLMSYNFSFNDSVAKFDHIQKFYEHDTIKCNRLARKLKDSHIHPKEVNMIQVDMTKEVLSRAVAAGISLYVDFEVIEKTGRHTATFLKNMNDFYDTLNSSYRFDTPDHKKAFVNETSQIKFLEDILDYFQSVVLMDPKTGGVAPTDRKFLEALQITIKSILLLFEDLKRDFTEEPLHLVTKKCSQDIIRFFYSKMTSKTDQASDITSRTFSKTFHKLFLLNITRPPKNPLPLDDNLDKRLTEIIDQIRKSYFDTSTAVELQDRSLKVNCLDYRELELDIPESNAIPFISVYLMLKCSERHYCNLFHKYVDIKATFEGVAAAFRFRRFKKHWGISGKPKAVPPDDFMHFVELMEEIFCVSFQPQYFTTSIGLSVLEKLKKLTFKAPCPCFPKEFLMKLFIRLRIYYTIRDYNSKRQDRFFVSSFLM